LEQGVGGVRKEGVEGEEPVDVVDGDSLLSEADVVFRIDER
jgi:hypothetical protein